MGWDARNKGWVDRVVDFRNYAVERFMPEPVVFHHVYKCGGTSIGRAMRKRYILSQTNVLMGSVYRTVNLLPSDVSRYGQDARSCAEVLLLYHMYKGVRCLVGHLPFSVRAYQAFKGKYKFISTLREPVDRFISHYNYHYRSTGLAIDEYLRSDIARENGAQYVRFFCGRPELNIYSDKSITSAIDNLELFNVIGFLDDMPAFSQAVGKELKISVSIRHENTIKTTPKHDQVNGLNSQQLNVIKALCEPDIAVYQAARQRFTSS